jgi:hypothetical protein
MMDEEHGNPRVRPQQADQNTYILGGIGKFEVVACLPKVRLAPALQRQRRETSDKLTQLVKRTEVRRDK